jgi:hypothetical protein
MTAAPRTLVTVRSRPTTVVSMVMPANVYVVLMRCAGTATSAGGEAGRR